jgi:hypothetical protein
MNSIKLISNLFSTINFDKNQYQSEDNLPYYRFNAYDYEKLLNPSDSEQTVVFKNQNQEEMKFKLIKSTLGKKTFKTLDNDNFWQKHFCFDEQEIVLECSKIDAKLIYNLKKFPSKTHQFKNDFHFYSHSKFIATIQFRLWNNNNLITVDYSKSFSTLIINSVFYTKVRVLETNNHQKIYFDEQNGVIGFDDIEGNIWMVSH